MTCAELNERLVDYLYQELGGEERQRLEAHLVGCPACRGEVAGLSRTLGRARQALRGPLSEEAPARVRADIMQAARAALPRPAPAPEPGPLAGLWAWLRKPWFLPALAAVSALAIFVIARPALMKPVPSSLPEGAPVAAEPTSPPAYLDGAQSSIWQPPEKGKANEAARAPAVRAPAARVPTRRYAVAPPTDDPSANGPLALGGLGRPVKVVSDGSRPQPDEATMRRMEALARASAARKRELPRPAFRAAAGSDPAPRAMPVAAPEVASAAELASAPRPSRVSPAPAPPASPTSPPREVYDLQLATRPPPAELAAAPAAAADEDTTERAGESEEASGPRKLAAERKGRVGASMGNAAGGGPVASGAGSAVAARAEPEARRDTATAKASAPAARAATARSFAAPPPAPAAAPTPAAVADLAGAVPTSSPPPLSLAQLQKRAERASRDGQHAEAAKHYRELLRRFPGHRDAPTWRRQLDAAIRALR